MCPSILCPFVSILCLDDNSEFPPNLVCALILWRSGLGLLMGKLLQFLTVICPPRPYFRFWDDNLSKLLHQKIFT